MENSKLRKYIFATIALIKKQAFQAKEKVGSLVGAPTTYNTGLLMGYAHILKDFRNYTIALWIDRKDLGLADIEPEADLLGMKSNPEADRRIKDMIEPLTEEKVEGYIYDLMTILKETAMEEQAQLDDPATSDDNGFDRGYLMAYYQIFSTMQDQAVLFGIDQKACNLSIIDPDRDLLPSLLKEKK